MDRLEFFNKCLETDYKQFEDIDWNDVRLYMETPMSLGFLTEFANELNWSLVAQHVYIPQSKVMKFKNFMDWDLYIRYKAVFTDTLIEIVSKVDNIDWDLLSRYSFITTHFAQLYYNKLNLEELKQNGNIDNDVIILVQHLLLQERDKNN